MTHEHALATDPQIHAALTELKDVIVAHYPTATFDTFYRDDPEGLRLRATVDIDDLDTVMDIVIDKLYEVQVERGLPVYVVMVQPHARLAEQVGERAGHRASLALPPLP